ncbi:MAG: glycosyltransferase family 9 protein [Ignavibacteriae bacterium]|nr:glycosyltransferase family 9 protein [Ignavibacteria bacterium]MBI3364909.1 glycosyltransferase family 9 protein [Ignavibacteriota bacterium]
MSDLPTNNKQPLAIPDCKHFAGYKPCFPETNCLDECADPQPYGTRILIVNLEAMGNVLVTTTLLPAIKRKYPQSTISWITLPNACRLLDNNPMIEHVYVWEPASWLKLQGMCFDVVMNIDKSVHAGAFTMSTNAGMKLGYGMNDNGVIIPLNPEAEYNYRLGLDDHLKFRVNQKSNAQLLTEAMGLEYRRDPYMLNLTTEEELYCHNYRREAGITAPTIVGFNTGCSLLYPNKKMTVNQHVVLIEELSRRNDLQLLLLGGPEDTERNAEIARCVGGKVMSTPTTEGVRRGICYENLCDVIISGDSFGMHIAIGLRKYVIAWFGVSCPQEIDLFNRGVKVIPEGLVCSPCWKKECPYNLECIQMIDLDRILSAVDEFRLKKHAHRSTPAMT